jgi:hypothetical protein
MFTVDIENNELLADEITTLAGQINAANYRFLKLVVEFDKRKHGRVSVFVLVCID